MSSLFPMHAALAMEAEARTKQQNAERAARNAHRWQKDLPDSDITVLLRLDDEEVLLLAAGYHDGEQWCFTDGAPVELAVRGWMLLEDAARILDGGAA